MNFIDKVKDKFQGTKDFVNKKVEGAGNYFKTKAIGIGGVAFGILKSVVDITGVILPYIFPALKGLKVIQKFQKVADTIKKIKELPEFIKGVPDKLKDGVVTFLKNPINSIKSVSKSIGESTNKVKNKVEDFSDAVKNRVSKFIDKREEAIRSNKLMNDEYVRLQEEGLTISKKEFEKTFKNKLLLDKLISEDVNTDNNDFITTKLNKVLKRGSIKDKQEGTSKLIDNVMEGFSEEDKESFKLLSNNLLEESQDNTDKVVNVFTSILKEKEKSDRLKSLNDKNKILGIIENIISERDAKSEDDIKKQQDVLNLIKTSNNNVLDVINNERNQILGIVEEGLENNAQDNADNYKNVNEKLKVVTDVLLELDKDIAQKVLSRLDKVEDKVEENTDQGTGFKSALEAIKEVIFNFLPNLKEVGELIGTLLGNYYYIIKPFWKLITGKVNDPEEAKRLASTNFKKGSATKPTKGSTTIIHETFLKSIDFSGDDTGEVPVAGERFESGPTSSSGKSLGRNQYTELTEEDLKSMDLPKVNPSEAKFSYPVSGTPIITSPFGWRSLPDGKGGESKNFHDGTDYSPGHKIAIAVEDVKVIGILHKHPTSPYRYQKIAGAWTEVNPKAWTPYVYVVGIYTQNKYTYKHGDSMVSMGEVIKVGNPICRIDGYGYSFGAHLHFGMYEYNKDKKKYKLVDPHATLSEYMNKSNKDTKSTYEGIGGVLINETGTIELEKLSQVNLNQYISDDMAPASKTSILSDSDLDEIDKDDDIASKGEVKGVPDVQKEDDINNKLLDDETSDEDEDLSYENDKITTDNLVEESDDNKTLTSTENTLYSAKITYTDFIDAKGKVTKEELDKKVEDIATRYKLDNNQKTELFNYAMSNSTIESNKEVTTSNNEDSSNSIKTKNKSEGFINNTIMPTIYKPDPKPFHTGGL